MTKRTFLAALACLLLITDNVLAQYIPTIQAPKSELRAVWITTLSNLDWPKTQGADNQKQELLYILNRLKAANINTVLLQARVRATTIYPSEIEPWDKCMTGYDNGNPGWDPMKFAVEECHKRGMEIQAWIATIPVGSWDGIGSRKLRAMGYDIRRLSSGAYMNPSDFRTGPYIARIAKEIVTKYDVDGIHLDYIRYPEYWRRPTYRNGDTPENRRDNITSIVEDIYKAVKSVRPWVKLTCSPIGKYKDLRDYSSKNWNAYDRVFQDAQGWFKKGIMDQLYPMIYFRGDNYYPFAADWAQQRGDKTVAAGLGTYFLDPSEGNWNLDDLKREMYAARQMGLGTAHFRYKFFDNNLLGVYSLQKNFFTPYPAIVPPMNNHMTKPAKPSDLRIENNILTWHGNAPFYNIYCSEEENVDINDGRNILLSRYEGTSMNLGNTAGKKLYFAVTAQDRYGNESEATTIDNKSMYSDVLLANDGSSLMLPDLRKEPLDADYFVIETLQGNIVAIRKYKRYGNIDIRSLRNGIYILRTINRKKIIHRIGFFIVKREL